MITDQAYLDSTAVSQSRLKKILIHPTEYLNASYDTEFDEPKANILVGDGVDILLTQSEEVFHERFHISNVERPTGQMGDFVWNLFINRDNDNAKEIAYHTVGFKRDSFDKVMSRFIEEGREYYDALVMGEKKTVITSQQLAQIYNTKDSLLTHRYTRKYFEQNDQYEVLYQVPIEFEYNGVKCKGLLDMLIVDKVNKTLTPVDIKTTNVKTIHWASMFWKLRYDFQAAFYSTGLLLGGYLTKYDCVGMNEFRFIVESQSNPGTPLVYKADHNIIQFGQYGGKMVTREYEGFDKAIERLKWHSDNDLWDYPMEDYENNGVRSITLPTLGENGN
jgi:hypothetical protein